MKSLDKTGRLVDWMTTYWPNSAYRSPAAGGAFSEHASAALNQLCRLIIDDDANETAAFLETARAALLEKSRANMLRQNADDSWAYPQNTD